MALRSLSSRVGSRSGGRSSEGPGRSFGRRFLNCWSEYCDDEEDGKVITLPVTYELGLSSRSTVLRIRRGAMMISVNGSVKQLVL